MLLFPKLAFFAIILACAVSTHCALFSSPQNPFKHLQNADETAQMSRNLPLRQHNDLSGGHALLALHKTLVSIPSTSGEEHAIAVFLESYLKAYGFEVELQAVAPLSTTSSLERPRFNVFAYLAGHRQTPVLLTSHIDTVPPFIPYAIRHDDQIWGRGTVDAKACVATQIYAYRDLVHSKQIDPQEASLLFVVGEEIGGDGMFTANSLGLSWDAVIFGEPTELKLAAGHKGLLGVTVKARGKGGHSGYPELGESAIDMILPALMVSRPRLLVVPFFPFEYEKRRKSVPLSVLFVVILRFTVHVQTYFRTSRFPSLRPSLYLGANPGTLQAGHPPSQVLLERSWPSDANLFRTQKLKAVGLPKSEKYGNTTVNIGRIRAGVAANVIAKEAEANIGIRIAAGNPQSVKDIVLSTIKSIDHRLDVSWSHAAYAPVDIDHDVPGFEVITVNYGTDIPNMRGHHKRYLYGPGSILVAHADDEHLKVQDLFDAVEGYKKLILFCLKKKPRETGDVQDTSDT